MPSGEYAPRTHPRRDAITYRDHPMEATSTRLPKTSEPSYLPPPARHGALRLRSGKMGGPGRERGHTVAVPQTGRQVARNGPRSALDGLITRGNCGQPAKPKIDIESTNVSAVSVKFGTYTAAKPSPQAISQKRARAQGLRRQEAAPPNRQRTAVG